MKRKKELEDLLNRHNDNPQALYEIAGIYKMNKDYKHAEEYYLKAINAGHQSAKYELEDIYANGYLSKLINEEATQMNSDDESSSCNGMSAQTKIIIALCIVVVLLVIVCVVGLVVLSGNKADILNTSSSTNVISSSQVQTTDEIQNTENVGEVEENNYTTEPQTVAVETQKPTYNPDTLEGVDTSQCWQVLSDSIYADELDNEDQYGRYIFGSDFYCYDKNDVDFDQPTPVEIIYYNLKDDPYLEDQDFAEDYFYIVMKIGCKVSGKTSESNDNISSGYAYMVMRAQYEVEKDTCILRLPGGVETLSADNDLCYVTSNVDSVIEKLDKKHSLYDGYEIKIQTDETATE